MTSSTTAVPSASGTRATRRDWIGLAVLTLPVLIVSMDVSVLFFAVPFISRDLEPTATQQLWIFDVYGFVLAGLLLTMGSIGDRIGRRRLLLIGAAAFGAASLLAAYAPTAEALILARALMGVGGATLMPSTLALLRNMFHDAKQRGTAIGAWSAAMTGGVAVGPVLSGLLLTHFWWGSVFLVNLPVMVLLLILAPVLVPEFRAPRSGRFDVLSSVLSLGAVLPTIYGIKELAVHGLEPVPVLCVLAGVGIGVLFVLRQRRPDPMLDTELFRRRAFSQSIATNTVAAFAMTGFAIFSTQYLQSVLGMSPLRAALWSLAPAVLVGAAAPLSTTVARTVDRAALVTAGLLLGAAGLVAMLAVGADSSLVPILVAASMLAIGLVVVMTLMTEVVVGVVPPERAGSATATSETAQEFGGAFGMAMLGSIGAAIYSRHLTDALPAGLDPLAAHQATQTLGGATFVAGGLPAAEGGRLLELARQSFVAGLHGAALSAAVVLVAAAVVTVVFRRRFGPLELTEARTAADAGDELTNGSATAAVGASSAEG